MRAFVCELSVTIPACEPVKDSALWPKSWIAIAHKAHEMRSPVESSMSSSRASGAAETSPAIASSSSVVLPRAESTATTRAPASRRSTMRRAARLMRCASATDVPPNFITTSSDTPQDIRVSAVGGRAAEAREKITTRPLGDPWTSAHPEGDL